MWTDVGSPSAFTEARQLAAKSDRTPAVDDARQRPPARVREEESPETWSP